jgi:glycosyltransferase involved in cell wall biosynthesis
MKNKIMILSLGRTGSLPLYADNIVMHFPKGTYDYYISKNAIRGTLVSNYKSVITYYSSLTFLFNTFFVLPIYLIRLLPKIIINYQVLYLPYFHLWNLPFILIFRLLGREVVLTVHDGILHKGENGYFIQKYSDLMLKASTKLIFLTKYVKINVETKFNIVKKSLIAPHGIIKNNYITHGLEKRGKNILFIGRISSYKGVELLVDVIEEIENEIDKCIIAGKSNYDLNLKDTDKLQILDKYLSEEEVGELLGWADILVLPYLEATQSGVIALGINAELPMVCTLVGGLQEQLKEDECIWVSPTKDSLKKGILKLIYNAGSRDILIGKMKERKKSLKWEVISSNIYNFINNENE